MSEGSATPGNDFWGDADGFDALERYRVLVNVVDDGIYQLDTEGRFVAVNETIVEKTGYARDALLGEHVSLVIDETESRRIEREIARRLETDERHVETFELSVRTTDGGTIPCELRMNLLVEDGEFRGTIGVVRDVSERKPAEADTGREDRGQELEQYETIVETIPDGAYVLDEAHRFQLVNETLIEMTGYDRVELLGSDAEMVSSEGGHERGLELRDQLRAGEIDVAVLEETIHAADGSAFDAEIRFDALGDEDGAFRGTAGVIRDVTERKEREQKLEELVDKLEESNERLEQFAYAASHDLQEPLRMVSSYLQLIEDRYADELDADGREFLAFAVDGADRMREMIDGLLQYSRVDTRGNPFEPVDLNAIFADVCEDLQVKIEESDAEIAAEDLPLVEGDDGQLRQVFQNLLDNALEYSGDEPPKISVTAERRGACRDSERGSAERSRSRGGEAASRAERETESHEPCERAGGLRADDENRSSRFSNHSASSRTGDSEGRCPSDHSSGQRGGLAASNGTAEPSPGPREDGTAAENEGDEWILSVSDEGIGINPDDGDRVFEVFQRLHTQDEHTGTGIGLALCERIVERHGGEIRVESEPGEGATFSFSLPAAGDRDE